MARTGGQWGPPPGPRFGPANPKKHVKNHVFRSYLGSRFMLWVAPDGPHWGPMGASGGHPQDPVLGPLTPKTAKKPCFWVIFGV